MTASGRFCDPSLPLAYRELLIVAICAVLVRVVRSPLGGVDQADDDHDVEHDDDGARPRGTPGSSRSPIRSPALRGLPFVAPRGGGVPRRRRVREAGRRSTRACSARRTRREHRADRRAQLRGRRAHRSPTSNLSSTGRVPLRRRVRARVLRPEDQEDHGEGHQPRRRGPPRVTVAHELTHTLQDQHFDLQKLGQKAAEADHGSTVLQTIVGRRHGRHRGRLREALSDAAGAGAHIQRRTRRSARRAQSEITAKNVPDTLSVVVPGSVRARSLRCRPR